MNADELLSIAIKNNQVIDYLRGTNGYRILSYNGDQSNAYLQDYISVISSFHRLQKSNPQISCETILFDSINELLDTYDILNIYTALKIIDLELTKEQTPYALFKIQKIEEILIKLRNELIKNKEKLMVAFPGETKSVFGLAELYSDYHVSKGGPSLL